MNVTPLLEQATKALQQHEYNHARDLLKDVALKNPATGANHRPEQLQIMRLHYIRGEVALGVKDYSEAAHELQEAHRLALELNEVGAACHTRELIGNMQRERNLPGLALEQHTWCLNYLEENPAFATAEVKISLLFSLALDYHALERYDEAIERYQQVGQLAFRALDSRKLAAALKGLATIYRNLDNVMLTRIYAYQAVGAYQSLGDSDIVIRLQGGLGRLLAKHGQYEEALHCATAAYQIAAFAPNLRNTLTTLVNLSEVHLQVKQFEEALKYSLEGIAQIEAAEENKATVNKITAAFVYAQVGKVLAQRGNLEDRLEVQGYYEKALSYLENTNHNYYRSQIYYQYAEILEQWGKLGEALPLIKQAVALGYANRPPVLEF